MCVCVCVCVCECVCVCVCEREREITQNSELYYSRIEILGSSLFLQSVLAKLHRQHTRERESVNAGLWERMHISLPLCCSQRIRFSL